MVPLKIEANAKFYKARSVPFALKSKVEAELADLQSKGIISPVKHSTWAAPIVPVLKKNGKVRICGNYKLTINQAAPTKMYSLPLIEELLTDMSGGKYFSKLDLQDATVPSVAPGHSLKAVRGHQYTSWPIPII